MYRMELTVEYYKPTDEQAIRSAGGISPDDSVALGQLFAAVTSEHQTYLDLGFDKAGPTVTAFALDDKPSGSRVELRYDALGYAVTIRVSQHGLSTHAALLFDTWLNQYHSNHSS